MTNKKCCMKTGWTVKKCRSRWNADIPLLRLFVQEMQKTFNSYKCLMISVNLSSRHFLRGDSAELQELQEALASANHSWTQACGGLESWERRLHSALMQCQVRHLHQRHNSDLTPTFEWKEFRDEWPLTSELFFFCRSSTRRCTLCCCGSLRLRTNWTAWTSAACRRRALSWWSTATRWRWEHGSSTGDFFTRLHFQHNLLYETILQRNYLPSPGVEISKN